MKKVKIIASLLTVSLLVACGKGTTDSSQDSHDSKVSSETSTVVESSVESLSDSSSVIEHSSDVYSSLESYSSESSDIQESSEEEYGWTSEQLSIFQNHLYGIVPPYVEMDGARVLYSEEDDMILIGGNQSSPGLIAAWSNALSEDGYFLESSSGTYYYLYSMIVTLSSGEDRYLFIEVTSIDDQGSVSKTGDGMFVASMYDPFTYDWPVDDIAYYMSCVDSNTTAVLPEYEADYYSFNLNYLSLNQFAVYCYTQNDDPEGEYAAILANAGYDVLGADEKDSYGYRRAFSSDLTVEVLFMYNAKAGQLVIIVEPYVPVIWPEAVDEWIDKFTDNSGTRIPQAEGSEGYEFHPEYYEDEGLVVLFVYGSSTYYQNLYFALSDANWTIGNTDTAGIFYAVSPLEDLLIQFGYFAEYGITQIVIMPYEAPAKEWPAEEIATYMSYVDSTSDTVLPEFPADEYEFNLTYLVTDGIFVIYCYVDSDTAVEDYSSILEAAGWTLAGYDSYGYAVAISPDSKVMVSYIYDETYQDLDIMVSPYYVAPSEWPTEEVAYYVDILTDNSGTVLPGIDGGTTYAVIADYYSIIGYIVVAILGAGDLSAAYAEILTDAGWDVYYYLEDGYYEAYSPNNDLYVQFSYDTKYEEFDIYFCGYTPLPTSWPAEDIENYLEFLGIESEYTIPSFEADQYQIDDSNIGNGLFWIYCYVDSNSAEANYAFTLVNEGWNVNPERNEDGYYSAVSPDEEIEVLFAYDAQYGDLDIGVHKNNYAPNEWPEGSIEYIVNLLTNNSGTVLPALEGGTAYNLITSIYEQYGYFVMFISGDASLVESYMLVLQEAGYEVTDNRNVDTYVTAVSPNKDLLVEFKYDADFGQVLLYISPLSTGPEWPADDIATALLNLFDVAPEIPPLIAGSSVEAEFDAEYSCVSIYVIGGTADDAFSYVSDLNNDGWLVEEDTSWSDSYYAYSPDGSFYMYVYFYNGMVEIDIYKIDPGQEWNAEAVAEVVANVCDDAATIPAYTYGYVTAMGYYSSYGLVQISLTDTDGDALSKYVSDLQNAGWIVAADPDYMNSYYANSPDGSIYLNVFLSTNEIVIQIFAGSYNIQTFPWPTNDAAGLLNILNIQDTVPAYDGTIYGVYVESEYYTSIIIGVGIGNVNSAIASYVQTLLDSGYTFYGEIDGIEYYLSPRSDLLIGVFAADNANIWIDLIVKPEGEPEENLPINPTGDPDKTLSENFEDWTILMGYSTVMPDFYLGQVDSITYDIYYAEDDPGYCYFDCYLLCAEEDIDTIYENMVIVLDNNPSFDGGDYGGCGMWDNGEVSIYVEVDGESIYVSICPSFY